jgi:MFS family permease
VSERWGGSTATFFSYTHLSHDLCTGLLTALIPLIRAGLGLSYLQSGVLLSAYTITSGLSQFAGGWIGDRMRRSIVMAIGLGGVGVMGLAVGLSPSYYPMLVILVVMGIFAGGYHPSAVSLLSSLYEQERRGKVIALHMVGGSIGFAIGPVLGGFIAEYLGWRYAYFILSLSALAAALLVFNKFRRGVPAVQSARRADVQAVKRGGMSLTTVLRPIVIIFVLAVSMQLIAGSAMAFLPIYLVDKHGIAPATATLMMGIIRGGGIAGSLFGGWLSDRWGRNRAIFLSLGSTGLCLYLLTISPFNAGFIVIMIVFGVLMYMRQSTVQPYLMDSVPSYLRATVFGVYFGLGIEGQSLIQPVAGHFMDIFGIADVFTAIAIITVGLSLVSLLLARRA